MSRQRILLIAAAAALALYFLVLAPVEDARKRIQEDIPVKTAQLAKHMKFVSKYTAEKETIEQRRQKLNDLEENIISDRDISLASATVQTLVRDMAEGASIRVTSIRALSPIPGELYRKLPVYVDGRCSIESIGRLMNKLSQSSELLSVDKIDILTANPKEDLRIRVQISGVMKNE